MFYCFKQNNSGGSFDFDEDKGITHFVIIEGNTLEDILNKAESIGIYFNGVENEMDCECCGDRWYVPWKEDLEDTPKIYEEDIKDYDFEYKWMPEGKEACVHYLDGRMEWYG